MSLVTVQRSPTPSEDADLDETDVDISECDSSSPRRCRSVTSSECFFYVKGTAVILLNHDRTNTVPTSTNDEIEEHLQSMLRIISPQHTLTMAVRLQTTSSLTASVNNEFDECCSFPCSTSSYSSLVSLSQDHARYLAVVTSSFRPASCSSNRNDDCNSADKDLSFNIRECVLLGLDCITNDEKATIGVVIPIHASTHIRLDGDGGISIDFDQSYHHLFRPVSVQAMWTMFQCLHKELREAQNAKTSPSQTARSDERMTDYYLKNISSQDAIRNEWERTSLEYCGDGPMNDLGATIADAERFNIERPINDTSMESKIHECLKEVMQTVDLDDVTSKDIRLKVEESMGCELNDYKDFISRQMMVIMGQMDKASQIFPYLYLGTEWNACDWQWLQSVGIEYIVNVTTEVENFFPARLKYLKIRVCDKASSELLKYWNQTNQFIKEAKEKGSAVLVHCKKGISRSSSTVIAYAMKEYGWGLSQAMEHVKKKRDCITPNKGFVEQLKTFEGMLDAFKKRDQFDKLLTSRHQSTPLICDSPICNERRKLRRKHLKLHHFSHNIIDSGSSKLYSHLEEKSSMVRSLVGSFEAKVRVEAMPKGEMLSSSSEIKEGEETNKRQRKEGAYEKGSPPSPVTFRLGELTDWNRRHTLGAVPMPSSYVKNAVSSIQSEIRALTISQ